MSDIRDVLNRMAEGDPQAASRLLPMVYQELRHLARQKMQQERPDHTLQATALVHEAYLRMMGSGPIRWENESHFFCAAAEAMRRILIEHARRKNALRHGGGQPHVALDQDIPEIAASQDTPEDLLALDDALARLALEDPQKADLVKLRYFSGLSLKEAAAAMGISRATASRYWTYARAWLHDAMTRCDGN